MKNKKYVNEKEENDRKNYFFDKYITYCFPYETWKTVKNYGVLQKYIDKKYTREEIDKIICEMIANHPYIEGSMFIKIRICKKEKYGVSYYHLLDFRNYQYERQKKHSLEIKYEVNC